MRNPRFALLTSLLLALALLVLCALPLAAAEADLARVEQLLATLQRIDVDPEWPPDMEAHAQTVQNMLDAFLRCTEAERQRLSKDQTDDLRTYFEALYKLQNKDAAELEALFAAAGAGAAGSAASADSHANSTSPAAGSSQTSAESGSATGPASSGATAESGSAESTASATANSPDSAGGGTSGGESSAVASTGSAAAAAGSTRPRPTLPPQVPKGEGFTALLGSAALGAMALLGLAACLLLVFLRFLAAIRAAGRIPQAVADADLRARELFGENYDDEHLLAGNNYVSQQLRYAMQRTARRGVQPQALETRPQRPNTSTSSKLEIKGEARTAEKPPTKTPPPQDNTPQTEVRGQTRPAAGQTKSAAAPPARRTGRPAKMPFDPADLDDFDDLGDWEDPGL